MPQESVRFCVSISHAHLSPVEAQPHEIAEHYVCQELRPPCGKQLLHRLVGQALGQRDGRSVVPLGALQVAGLEGGVSVGTEAVKAVDVDRILRGVPSGHALLGRLHAGSGDQESRAIPGTALGALALPSERRRSLGS